MTCWCDVCDTTTTTTTTVTLPLHSPFSPPFRTPHSLFSNCHFQPNNNNKSRALLLLLQLVVVVAVFLQFILLRLGLLALWEYCCSSSTTAHHASLTRKTLSHLSATSARSISSERMEKRQQQTLRKSCLSQSDNHWANRNCLLAANVLLLLLLLANWRKSLNQD